MTKQNRKRGNQVNTPYLLCMGAAVLSAVFAVAAVGVEAIVGPNKVDKAMAKQRSISLSSSIFSKSTDMCDSRAAYPRTNTDFSKVAEGLPELLLNEERGGDYQSELVLTSTKFHQRYARIHERLQKYVDSGLTFCFDRKLNDEFGNSNIVAAYYPDYKLVTADPRLLNDSELVGALNDFLVVVSDSSESLLARANGKGVAPTKSRDYWKPLHSLEVTTRPASEMPPAPISQ